MKGDYMKSDKAFELIIKMFTLVSVTILGFIIFFIGAESIPAFRHSGVAGFFANERWHPIGTAPVLSILPMVLATIYVSFLAVAIALPIGVGTAVFLSCIAGESARRVLKPFIDLMAGLPSVVFGFMGLIVVVGYFERHFSMSSGESALAGGIVLAIMILPYIVSTCDTTMAGIMKSYKASSDSLGVSKWHMVRYLVLPAAKRSVLAGAVLALARGMGETMAVMMVIGNSPLLPRLLGKCETIPALIALEMGGAPVGSLHYHALFAAGLILIIMRFAVSMAVWRIKRGADL